MYRVEFWNDNKLEKWLNIDAKNEQKAIKKAMKIYKGRYTDIVAL